MVSVCAKISTCFFIFSRTTKERASSGGVTESGNDRVNFVRGVNQMFRGDSTGKFLIVWLSGRFSFTAVRDASAPPHTVCPTTTTINNWWERGILVRAVSNWEKDDQDTMLDVQNIDSVFQHRQDIWIVQVHLAIEERNSISRSDV